MGITCTHACKRVDIGARRHMNKKKQKQAGANKREQEEIRASSCQAAEAEEVAEAPAATRNGGGVQEVPTAVRFQNPMGAEVPEDQERCKAGAAQ